MCCNLSRGEDAVLWGAENVLYYEKQRMAVIWKAENVMYLSKQRMRCTLVSKEWAVLLES